MPIAEPTVVMGGRVVDESRVEEAAGNATGPGIQILKRKIVQINGQLSGSVCAYYSSGLS